MTSSYFKRTGPAKRATGFTLVEVMIAATLGSIILAGVLSAFLTLVRNGIRTSNYTIMEAQTRTAFEQLGIDARMASRIVSNPAGGPLTSITLTIPNKDQVGSWDVTYVYDTSDATDKKLVMVPGSNPASTVGRRTLINKIQSLSFLRYDTGSVLVPDSTTSDDTVKHIQISLNVARSGVGVAVATQLIRSSAFTLRNK